MKGGENRAVLCNGIVIDPSQGIHERRDLLIEDGCIVAIDAPGSFQSLEGAQSIDVEGQFVVPGLIDIHVHLREPGQEWKETVESGAQAAVLGGFTTVCAMPNTVPRTDCREVTQFILEKAQEAQLCRVNPIGAVSLALAGKEMAPLSELLEAGCVAFSDDGEPVFDALLMRRALEWCSYYDVTICCHEEDKCLSHGGCMNESSLSARLGLPGWPAVAEEVMIARDIELSRTTKAPLHFCHVSTARGAELIRRAKNDGIPVTAEVTPHHLTLTEERVGEYDTNAKMSPPLRTDEDVDALRQALRDGTIDAIASDHAPHEYEQKVCEFEKAAFGILGLQTNLPVCLDLVRRGHLSLERVIESFTAGPAKALRLPGGTLKQGARADITTFRFHDSVQWRFEQTINASKSKNSPWLGESFPCALEYVFVDGKVVVQSGKLATGGAQ